MINAYPTQAEAIRRAVDVKDRAQPIPRIQARMSAVFNWRQHVWLKNGCLERAFNTQPEYDLTRSELAIMREQVAAMAACLGPEVLLIEYGSGSGRKARHRPHAADSPVAYGLSP